MAQLVRTQISLPKDVKERINQDARQYNISMAEYLRRAVLTYKEIHLSKQKQRDSIARALAGSFKDLKGGWSTTRKVVSIIRRERQKADERLT